MMSAIERLLSKISISAINIYDGTFCWEWTKSMNQYGYGLIKINRKTIQTHRFIYEYYRGQICPDLELDHLCRNRACCNPFHLQEVTHKENLLRGNTINAINARKTHCPKGHEYDEENTYYDPATHARRCRTCRREKSKINRITFYNEDSYNWQV